MEIEVIRVNELVLHELAESTPMMNDEQYAALKHSIEQNGQQEPITVYRGKIVDGRHRWLIMQDIGSPTIKAVRLPNNTTIAELESLVQAKETRRHETASQLAIRAYRLSLRDGYTQASAAKELGANVKRVSEAKKIAVTYKREDILELLHRGKKLNIGTEVIPFNTDSLGTICRWLAENNTILPAIETSIGKRKQLNDSEIALINSYFNIIHQESTLVVEELASMLYASVKEKMQRDTNT